DILQSGRADLLLRRGRLEVVQGADVATHAGRVLAQLTPARAQSPVEDDRDEGHQDAEHEAFDRAEEAAHVCSLERQSAHRVLTAEGLTRGQAPPGSA